MSTGEFHETGSPVWVEAVSGAAVFPDANNWQVGQIAIGVHGTPGMYVAHENICPINSFYLYHCSGLIPLLDPILDASHARNRRISPPNSVCFPGTRKGVLKNVRSWVEGSLLLNNPHSMWVYGYAGCGKSAITQEIADYFARKGRLAASFFFFRGAGDRSRIVRFAATLASQIAEAIPATAPLIEAGPGVTHRSHVVHSATTAPCLRSYRSCRMGRQSGLSPARCIPHRPRRP